MRTFLTSILLLMLIPVLGLAQTVLPDTTIDGGIFLLSESPYVLTGYLLIENLTIEAGVVVQAGGNGIMVTGLLIAVGAVSDSIVFTTADGVSDWDGLIFDQASLGTELAYCQVEKSRNSGIRIVNSSPVIRNCTIANNTSQYGAGLRISGSQTVTLQCCSIRENGYTGRYPLGGGIYTTAPLKMIHCEVVDNAIVHYESNCFNGHDATTFGGGIYATANLDIQNVLVMGNLADSHGGVENSRGGGVYSAGSFSARNCTFAQNSAAAGGCNLGGGARGYGGGIYVGSTVAIANCIVVENNTRTEGGGIYAESDAQGTLENCTIAFNSQGGIIALGSDVSLVNSIVYFNLPFQISGNLATTYCDVEYGRLGEGNIDEDPLLISQPENPIIYTILDYSPCIDTGHPSIQFNDQCWPPSFGSARNDMGAHGGPTACDWVVPGACTAIHVSPLVFPSVSLGDTVSGQVLILNNPPTDYSFDYVALPSAEMQFEGVLPHTIQSGTIDTLTFILFPRNQTSISGFVVLQGSYTSMDLSIPVTADIWPLAIETQVSYDNALIGTPTAVTVRAVGEARFEQGHLSYKLPGTDTFSETPLTRDGEVWRGIIPGEAMVLPGLEYFVHVENSGVLATDPPGAPQDSLFYLPIIAPPAIRAIPIPNSGQGFEENLDILVQVTLSNNSDFLYGSLHYRRGGETDFQTQDLLYRGSLLSATIPAVYVGSRGLEFWVSVHGMDTVLTDPPNWPNEPLRAIQVVVQNLRAPHPFDAGSYHMISVPLDFGDEFVGTLETMLLDDLGAHNPSHWRCFRYLTDVQAYLELSNEGTELQFRPVPGNAYWLISARTFDLTTAPIRGLSPATVEDYTILLAPGWNQVGNPFSFGVAWDSCMVDTLMMSEAESTMVEPLIGWNAGSGYQYGVQVLEPFAGYWIKNVTESSVTLKVPPLEVEDTPALISQLIDTNSESSWRISISASCVEMSDTYNHFGMHEDARNAWDPLDRLEAPMNPGSSLSLYFAHTVWETRSGNYTVDIRDREELPERNTLPGIILEPDTWGNVWRFDVAKNFSREVGGDNVTLEFSGIVDVPVEAKIYLIDHHLDRLIDLRKQNVYWFFLAKRDVVSEDDARFAILVGSEAFIESHDEQLPRLPATTALHQNYPNPFNPSTIVRYEIAKVEEVVITIYDIKGSLVKALHRGYREPGRYEMEWDGKNAKGVQVASGIYFYRLVAGDFVQTKKMVLLR